MVQWVHSDPFMAGTLLRADRHNVKLNGIAQSMAEIYGWYNKELLRLPSNFTGNNQMPDVTYTNSLIYFTPAGDLNVYNLDTFDASVQTAITKAGEAANSASNAATSESNSANSASQSASSASNANTAANNSATSASESLASKNAAQTSETNAASSATNSANSAGESLASKNAAKISETNSKNSETATAASQQLVATDKATIDGYVTATLNAKNAAQTSESNAANSEASAQNWAIKAEDTQVTTGKFSALHYAAKAAASAATAQGYATGTAPNANKLGNQLPSYYENIPARLGYTPLSENINVDVSFKNNKKLTFGDAGEVEEYFNGNDFNTKVKTGSHYRYAQNYSYEFVNDTLQGFWNYIGLNLPDQKELRLGNSADLRLFSTGLNSYIQNETGEFHLRNTSDGGDVFITSKTTGGVLHTGFAVIADVNVYAQQYYNGQLRTKTTDAGFDVTGMLILNGKGAISGDNWLRINEHSQHASGIYTGTSPIVSAAFRVGTSGETFEASDAELTYKGNRIYHKGYNPTIADIANLETRLQNGTGLVGGSSSDDPDLTILGTILTSHANCPSSDIFWFIETKFWSTKAIGANKSQVATSYNGSVGRMYQRHRYNGTWTDWVRCDLGGKAEFAKRADNVAGYVPSPSSTFTSNALVTRDSSGYIQSSFFKSTTTSKHSSPPTSVFIEISDDGYIRKQTPKLLLKNLKVRTSDTEISPTSQVIQGSLGTGVNDLTIVQVAGNAAHTLSAGHFSTSDSVTYVRTADSLADTTITTSSATGNFYFNGVNKGKVLTISGEPHKVKITKSDGINFVVEVLTIGAV